MKDKRPTVARTRPKILENANRFEGRKSNG
jgi:hypothetical protein